MIVLHSKRQYLFRTVINDNGGNHEVQWAQDYKILQDHKLWCITMMGEQYLICEVPHILFFLPCRVKITLLQHLGLLLDGCGSDTLHVPNPYTLTHTHNFNMPLSRDSKSFSSWLNPNNVLRVVPCLMEINISLDVLMRYKPKALVLLQYTLPMGVC